MKKSWIIQLLLLAAFLNACNLQNLPVSVSPYNLTPSPKTSINLASPAISSTQPITPNVTPSYTPTLYGSDTPANSPHRDISGTPTFSPTLTPIPSIEPGHAIALVNIYMMDEQGGWGIEENGHLVHTNDSAATWDNVTPPQGAYNANGFFALDSQTAWATPYCLGNLFGGGNTYYCGGEANHTYVWVTHDGGITWHASLPVCLNNGCNRLTSSEGDGSLLPESIRFIDDHHGWLVISNGFSMNQNRYNGFYTIDGGETWNFLVSERTNGIISGSITALEALDEKNTFLFTDQVYGALAHLGNNLWYSKSTDGGNSWADIHFALLSNPLGDPAWDYLDCGTIESKAIPELVLDLTQECHDPRAVTQENSMFFIHLHSVDLGRTWKYWRQTGNVDFLDSKSGWQIVTKGNTAYELQQTRDGGLTWNSIKTVTWDGILNFVNDQVGYALAYNQGTMAVMYTDNGGISWVIKTQASLSRVPCLISTWGRCNR